MRLLAFDTSTDRLSVAAARCDAGVWQSWTHDGAGGAAASRDLLPVIQRLLAQGGFNIAQLDAIVFGCGPGAFTGLRTACAVAQGLSFGALGGPRRSEIPVLPVDTLMVLAEEARHRLGLDPGACVLSMLDARMDEIYSAPYRFDGRLWERMAPHALGGPEHLSLPQAWVPDGTVLAGNVFNAFGSRLPASLSTARQETVLPGAAALLRLAPAMIEAGLAVGAAQAQPLYIRDKVAQTEAERAAARTHGP